MAIDKAIDSTAFDSKLKSVADAIRSAGGTTDMLAFPDAMVAAITAIQAGGEYIIEHGSRTFTEDTFPYKTPIIIEHSLGKRPLIFFGVSGTNGLFASNAISYIVAIQSSFSAIHPVRGNSNFYCVATGSGSRSMSIGNAASRDYISMNATQVTISASSSNHGFFFYSDQNTPAVLNWWAIAKK